MTVSTSPRTSGPARQLADRAYFELRDRIVDLRLPPGSRLREDELIREMGIGRTPLREAVKRLALEHLVEVRPRRGTQVTEVQAEDIARVAEVRAELEAHAARLASERMAPEHRDEAQALATDIAAAPESDHAALLRLDERVHRLVWRAADNGYLEATLEGYFSLSLRVWHLAVDRVPSLPGAIHGHDALLEALRDGDAERAAALMRDHVLAFEGRIADVVASG